MRAAAWMVLAALGAGCIPQLRAAVIEHQQLARIYAEEPRPLALHTWMEFLGAPAPNGDCHSLWEPCLATLARPAEDRLVFCMNWGANRNCYQVRAVSAGTVLEQLEPTNPPLFQWLVEHVDAQGYADANTAAAAAAEAMLARESEEEVSAHTFWAQGQFTLRLSEGIGFHARGGWRRWLGQYLLVSVGPGYERTLTQGGPPVRDALSLNTRLEFSSYSREYQSRVAELPLLSGYLGVTGLVGVSPTVTSGFRGYVGVSTVFLVSLEVGLSTVYAPGFSPTPSLYVGAGLGF